MTTPKRNLLGMITFVDARKVRRKRDPGRCFRKAGFREVGATKGGLIALQLLPHEMPAPEPSRGMNLMLFEKEGGMPYAG